MMGAVGYMTNYTDLIKALRCDEYDEDLIDCWECKYGKNTECCDTARLMSDASQAIEELLNIVPKNCFCCIGCEVEPEDGSGCDTAFVLSLDRARTYLNNFSTK